MKNPEPPDEKSQDGTDAAGDQKIKNLRDLPHPARVGGNSSDTENSGDNPGIKPVSFDKNKTAFTESERNRSTHCVAAHTLRNLPAGARQNKPPRKTQD